MVAIRRVQFNSARRMQSIGKSVEYCMVILISQWHACLHDKLKFEEVRLG